MDYSFAPGETDQDGRARSMFSRRPNTVLISTTGERNTVKQFIDHVTDNNDITKPVGDHLLASHASGQGFLFIPFFPGQHGPTDFETLQKTIDEPDKSIKIKDTTIGYTDGDTISKGFHIKGCNIGKAVPFLEKLKEALGEHVKVTAPVHFHVLHDLSALGIFEGMSYEFRINRKKAFVNRDEVITEFKGKGFKFYDNSNIPDDSWGNWLPTRLTADQLKTRQRLSKALRVNLSNPVGTTSTLADEIEFRVTPDTFTYTIEYDDPPSVPSGAAQQEAALKSALGEDEGFSSSHDFPMYQRCGYTGIDEFIAGYTWSFTKNGKILACSGKRFEYTVAPPVLNTTTGNYICNFYPNAGSPHPAVLDQLVVTDTNFFKTV